MQYDKGEHPEAVSSRTEFAKFVDSLRADLAANPEGWENKSLDDFLRALADYAYDVPSYLSDVGSEIDPNRPSWCLFSILLCGARVYE